MAIAISLQPIATALPYRHPAQIAPARTMRVTQDKARLSLTAGANSAGACIDIGAFARTGNWVVAGGWCRTVERARQANLDTFDFRLTQT